MLELARGVSQWAHGFKHAVIFLFNTGEEDGLNGAHSFITQVNVDSPSFSSLAAERYCLLINITKYLDDEVIVLLCFVSNII